MLTEEILPIDQVFVDYVNADRSANRSSGQSGLCGPDNTIRIYA